MLIRVNVGCGMTPIDGWHNYDNSWSIRLARIPLPITLYPRLGIVSPSQVNFLTFARRSQIRWADATKRIPEREDSTQVVYSSHMLDFLDRDETTRFLQEAHRVLRRGGVIRIAVANLRYLVERYLASGEADRFVERIQLARAKARGFLGKVKYLVVGDRNRKWMYDEHSLCNLLSASGFQHVQAMEPGSTMIEEPGALDLRERSPESVFAEGFKP